MSARRPDALGLGLVAATGVEQAEEFCDAIEAFHTAVGATPRKITWASPKVTTRAYKPATLRNVVGDPKATSMSTWAERGSDCPRINFHLHDRPGVEDYEHRWSGVVAPGLEDPAPLLALAATLTDCVAIISGSLGRYRDGLYAEHEGCGARVLGELDDATYARISEDEMLWRRARTKLRRLYPVTIIGPDIWAAMPPMPAFDPMPTVENLGRCKLVTAWPTLCEPRDPAFLRGTRELRVWLWPYTIQNPADHVDNDPKD